MIVIEWSTIDNTSFHSIELNAQMPTIQELEDSLTDCNSFSSFGNIHATKNNTFIPISSPSQLSSPLPHQRPQNLSSQDRQLPQLLHKKQGVHETQKTLYDYFQLQDKTSLPKSSSKTKNF